MIYLYDKKNGALIGKISEEELKVLIDQFEEESLTDKDYYINQDSVDLLSEAGAGSNLITILRSALGESGEAEIRWSRE